MLQCNILIIQIKQGGRVGLIFIPGWMGGLLQPYLNDPKLPLPNKLPSLNNQTPPTLDTRPLSSYHYFLQILATANYRIKTHRQCSNSSHPSPSLPSSSPSSSPVPAPPPHHPTPPNSTSSPPSHPSLASSKTSAATASSLQGIVPEGTNSHTFSPSPSVAATLARADLIIANGLFLEEPTLNLADSAKKDDTPVLLLGDNTISRDQWAFDFSFPESEGHPNPHLWPDPTLALRYAQLARDALVDLDPSNSGLLRHKPRRLHHPHR